MRHRFTENAGTIEADASWAVVSGGIAYGELFLPHSTADRGERLNLRIRLPTGETAKAEGTVKRVRGNVGTPGCDVVWTAVSTKSVDAIREWLRG